MACLRSVCRLSLVLLAGLLCRLAVAAAVGAAMPLQARRNAQALLDLRVILSGNQIVEKTADLPRCPRCIGGALFESVEFFQYHHWNEQIVFLEAEQTARIVHQHVGVKHEDFFLHGVLLRRRMDSALPSWQRR